MYTQITIEPNKKPTPWEGFSLRSKREFQGDWLSLVSQKRRLSSSASVFQADENKLHEIDAAIEASEYILDLKDDWDDEGSIGYEVATWKRTVDLLKTLSKNALSDFGVVIDAPKIYHGPNGGIDMLWKTEGYKVLAHFPKDELSPITFYGDTLNQESFEGSFTISSGGCSLMMFLIGAKQCTP
jgi:hypothetical protein